MTTTQTATGERADFLASLARHREFLRHTTRGLTDEQAAQRPTVSVLCPGRPDQARRADRAAVD
ncbi:MAG: hypothetical protein ACR2FU_12465 [Streptosporangiaceae bacterium]